MIATSYYLIRSLSIAQLGVLTTFVSAFGTSHRRSPADWEARARRSRGGGPGQDSVA